MPARSLRFVSTLWLPLLAAVGCASQVDDDEPTPTVDDGDAAAPADDAQSDAAPEADAGPADDDASDGDAGAAIDQACVQAGNCLEGIQEIAAGSLHTCARLEGGKVRCWGGNLSGELGQGITGLGSSQPLIVESLQEIQQIVAGDTYSCARTLSGRVRCWGGNGDGTLGIGTFQDSPTPVEVPNLGDVEQLAAGAFHVCALRTNGTVWCWGLNMDGQVGAGHDDEAPSPVQVSNLRNVRQISAGNSHTCAVTTDDELYCWGQNMQGQLGDGSIQRRLQPTLVALDAVTQVSAGGFHTCAVITGGKLACWGGSSMGQLGLADPDPVGAEYTPVELAGVSGVRSVQAAAFHTCSIHADAHLECWGANMRGQLGVGAGDQYPTPQRVAGMDSVQSVSSTLMHTCAVMAGGTAHCWGGNDMGQLGRSTTTDMERLPGPVLR